MVYKYERSVFGGGGERGCGRGRLFGGEGRERGRLGGWWGWLGGEEAGEVVYSDGEQKELFVGGGVDVGADDARKANEAVDVGFPCNFVDVAVEAVDVGVEAVDDFVVEGGGHEGDVVIKAL